MSKKQSGVKDLTKIVKEENNLVTFLNICRQEWRRIHPSEIKKKGRPSQKDLVWTVCDNAVRNNKLRTPFTQNKVINKIKGDVGTLSEKTLQTHVKTWIIDKIEVTEPSKASKGQLLWLQKNDTEFFNFVTTQMPCIIRKCRESREIIKKVPLTFREALYLEGKGVNFTDPQEVELVLRTFKEFLT